MSLSTLQSTQRHQAPPTMSPVTRSRPNRAQVTGEDIKPLSPALASNTLNPTRPSHSHVRFDQDEESMPTTARRVSTEMDEITKEMNGEKESQVNKANGGSDEIPDSEEEDSDDDAPEAVSMGAGKEEAEKREEEAKRVVEAYVLQ